MNNLLKDLYAFQVDGKFFSDLFPRANEVYAALQPPDVDMAGFSERELEILAETQRRYRSWVLDRRSLITADDTWLIEKCIKAALRREDAGWQDISTAPRDGAEVDIWDQINKRRYTDCVFHEGQWYDKNSYLRFPSHWMPLPKPPQDAIKSALEGND